MVSVDTGATAPTAYHIGVVSKGDALDEKTTAVILDDVDSPEDIRLTWSDGTLKVYFPWTARLFRTNKIAYVNQKTIMMKLIPVDPAEVAKVYR